MKQFINLALAASLCVLCGCASTARNEQGDIPSDAVRIANVIVVDVSGEAPPSKAARDIFVRDGQIIAVRDHDARNAYPNSINATGLTALPGLYDMHVHLWDEDGLAAYLAHGVTTIRNMSGMPLHVELQARLGDGELFGPRLLTTGPILNSQGPNAQINHQIVTTAEEARQAVRAHHAAGFRELKVYSNLTREAYEAIKQEAAELGMTISGHTPEGVRDPGVPLTRPFRISFDEILDDGFVTIEHIESIAWHGLPNDDAPEAMRALGRKIAAAGVPVTTTLLAHYNLTRVAETKGAYALRDGVELLNPFIQQMEQASIDAWASRDARAAARLDAQLAQMTRIFVEEGVLLVAGTDAGIFTNIPGRSLIDELELLVQAGLTSFEALQTTIWNPALALDEASRHGRLAPGYVADLALYACAPLEDIACLRSPEAVMRAGTYLDAAALDRLLEQAANQDFERSMENALTGLAAQGVVIDLDTIP